MTSHPAGHGGKAPDTERRAKAIVAEWVDHYLTNPVVEDELLVLEQLIDAALRNGVAAEHGSERRAAPQASTRTHLRGPWVYASASEEGSAVVSPPTEDQSADPWWTAIIDCADDDVANDIARLMHAAPDLLAALLDFMENPKFQVSVGGNPIAVTAMMERARAAIALAEGR